MGTQYTTKTAAGYNASPPTDAGAIAAENLITWAGIKQKLTDPLHTQIDAVNTALVTALDVSIRQITAADSTVAGDNMKTVEIAPTVTNTITVSLGDASTMTSNYLVRVRNSSFRNQVISRVTGGDTIDGTAGNMQLPSMGSILFSVNAGANGYVTLANNVYSGLGESQNLRLARIGSMFYDDFLRANTSAGSLGIPETGTTYQLLGINTASAATQTNISGGRWISAAGDITYATQTLPGNVTKMGMTLSWVTGNAGSDPGAAAMLIGPTQTAGSLAVNLALHLIITRTAWTLQTYTTSTPTTVASGSFSPTLSLNTPYTFEVTFGRNTAHFEFAGVVGDCSSSAFTANIGKFATWEHFYASSSVSDLVRFESIWAGTSPYPLSSLYEDSSGIIYANGIALSTVQTNARLFYSGGSAGYNFIDSTGVVSLATLSNAGAFVATTSILATTTVTAGAASGYYLGNSLFALTSGNSNDIFAGSAGLTIKDNTGALVRFAVASTGVVGIGQAAAASTAMVLPASTTAISSLRIPQGSAPTSPVNGDVWTTSAGLFVRINGGTVGPLS